MVGDYALKPAQENILRIGREDFNKSEGDMVGDYALKPAQENILRIWEEGECSPEQP